MRPPTVTRAEASVPNRHVAKTPPLVAPGSRAISGVPVAQVRPAEDAAALDRGSRFLREPSPDCPYTAGAAHNLWPFGWLHLGPDRSHVPGIPLRGGAMPGDPTSHSPYRDSHLPVDQRVNDLLARMSLEDKAGLLFHAMTFAGDVDTANTMFPLRPPRKMIDDGLRHFSVFASLPDGRAFAEWHNTLQRIAADHPLAIPVTLSSDPRHHFNDNPLASVRAGPFSQWPEPLGLAAIGSEELVREFADIARQEYVAVGLRVALHPQIDLATEPRWVRISATFGEDADLTSRLAVAYIRGFQTEVLGIDSVATMAKHFPGGGPQKDGDDPHFSWGREQVYPGGNFQYHLEPFRAAIRAGTSQIMPYYGMPVGTEYEEVGFSYNKAIITGILRE